MTGLTALGTIHTIIAVAAVAAAVRSFIRYGYISPCTNSGNIYIWLTVATCITGFGIFQHGGFGKPHALGIITLLVLGIAFVAGRTRTVGKASPYIETVSYSATVFFHMIPAIAEGATRLPPGAPLFDNPEAPALQALTAACFLVFVAGASYQVWRLRGTRHTPAAVT